MPTDSETDTLKCFWCSENMFIHMSAWIVGRNSKKHYCPIRKKTTEGIKGSDFNFRF